MSFPNNAEVSEKKGPRQLHSIAGVTRKPDCNLFQFNDLCFNHDDKNNKYLLFDL